MTRAEIRAELWRSACEETGDPNCYFTIRTDAWKLAATYASPRQMHSQADADQFRVFFLLVAEAL